jgi:hypothetical protein
MPGIHGSRAHAENVLFCVCWSHLPPVLRLGAACEVHTCDGVMHMTYIGGWQDRQQRGIEVALSTARPKNKNQREGGGRRGARLIIKHLLAAGPSAPAR